MTDEYTNERVIGHHIGASEETTTLMTGTELTHIRITEGDVDWADTHTIRLYPEELADLYHTFIASEGSP